MTSGVDELDARIVSLYAAQPRIGVLECSRRLRVARGTVQARLDKLQARGVVRSWGPDLDPAAMGYVVMAFASLEIRQRVGATGGGHHVVTAHLVAIPEVLEAHTITGSGDMLVRLVARSNADLQRVIDAVVSCDAVVRTATLIVMDTQIPYRLLPLLHEASGAADGPAAMSGAVATSGPGAPDPAHDAPAPPRL